MLERAGDGVARAWGEEHGARGESKSRLTGTRPGVSHRWSSSLGPRTRFHDLKHPRHLLTRPKVGEEVRGAGGAIAGGRWEGLPERLHHGTSVGSGTIGVAHSHEKVAARAPLPRPRATGTAAHLHAYPIRSLPSARLQRDWAAVAHAVHDEAAMQRQWRRSGRLDRERSTVRMDLHRAHDTVLEH